MLFFFLSGSDVHALLSFPHTMSLRYVPYTVIQSVYKYILYIRNKTKILRGVVCEALSTNRLYALTIQCMAEEIQKEREGEYSSYRVHGGKKEPMNKLCTIEGFLLRCIILKLLLQVLAPPPTLKTSAQRL